MTPDLENNDFCMEDLTIKTLAVAYYPKLLAASASQRLRRMIKQDTELQAELKDAGMRAKQRNLTFRQRDIIFDHIGIPRKWRHLFPDITGIKRK